MIDEEERALLQRKIATRLATARTEANLTKAQVARDLGVHWNFVHKWETGKTLPSALYIVMLAQLLGVTTDYLLGLVDEVAFDPTDDHPERARVTPPLRRLVS